MTPISHRSTTLGWSRGLQAGADSRESTERNECRECLAGVRIRDHRNICLIVILQTPLPTERASETRGAPRPIGSLKQPWSYAIAKLSCLLAAVTIDTSARRLKFLWAS